MRVEQVYQVKVNRTGKANQAVAIYCSDNRYQEAFREFLTEGLGLSTYAPLAIPGGAHFAAADHIVPKFTKVGFQSVGFLLKRTGASRIIIIGHHDCLYFKERLEFFHAQSDFNEKQFASLQAARTALVERFNGASVELYFADADPSGTVRCLKID